MSESYDTNPEPDALTESHNSVNGSVNNVSVTFYGDETAAVQSSLEQKAPIRLKWRSNAACRNLDTNLFFPSGEGDQAQIQIEKAKEICGKCAVKYECLEYALQNRQEEGIWGGKTPGERKALQKILRRKKSDEKT